MFRTVSTRAMNNDCPENGRSPAHEVPNGMNGESIPVIIAECESSCCVIMCHPPHRCSCPCIFPPLRGLLGDYEIHVLVAFCIIRNPKFESFVPNKANTIFGFWKI